jgi:damage-control phosphatase, subfamily I
MNKAGPISRPMAIRPECHGCLQRLIDLAVELASADPEVRRQAREASLQILDRELGPEAIPARLANRMLPAIYRVSGNPDPFAERKAAATELAAKLFSRQAPAYGDDLESLLRLAVAGNALDFFRGEKEVSQEMQTTVEFGLSHLPELRRELAGPPGLLLYLADNAGEQFFDRPLVDFLRRQGWQVLYVVKGGPIQNDLTQKDLEASDASAALAPVVDTGAATVGLELAAASPEFQRLFGAARIILAKGMGHFETMSHLPDPRVWFLLQAKCAPVARSLGVKRNTFVFIRTPAISLDTAAQTK